MPHVGLTVACPRLLCLCAVFLDLLFVCYQSIARSADHGILPAPDAETVDSLRSRRRRCVEPTRVSTL